MAELPNVERVEEITGLITQEIELPIVTKWLIIGEGIDSDGDKVSFYLRPDGVAPWDELGLIEWHRQYRQAQRAPEDG